MNTGSFHLGPIVLRKERYNIAEAEKPVPAPAASKRQGRPWTASSGPAVSLTWDLGHTTFQSSLKTVFHVTAHWAQQRLKMKILGF